jgi:ABC-type Mn2+/Zn2+ transport system ATPase subunit
MASLAPSTASASLPSTRSGSASERLPKTRLEACRLGIHFGDRSALEAVDLVFSGGEAVSILGPNGAGKSTLLKALSGMLLPTHGEIRIDGQPVRGCDRRVVYVPQRSAVDWTFPISVLDVALMGITGHRSRLRPFSATERGTARDALAAVGMDHLARVQIGQLSGGQQQRVFLARALLQEGGIYLLDEPFTGVDVPTQGLLVELFDRLKRRGRIIVYATHDLALAATSSDRVVLLNRRLVADGTPAAVLTPDHLRRAFGGQAVVPFSGMTA